MMEPRIIALMARTLGPDGRGHERRRAATVRSSPAECAETGVDQKEEMWIWTR